ncbi:MAG: trigger factor [Chromatiales bacterium]|nr:MAG: trigger factor [Chromatiales bacterium]
MSELQVALETRDGLERALRVQVPAARIDAEVSTRLQKVGRTAKIKGFRPGKVPAKVIRQRYGDQVRQEVLQDVLQASYSEAVAREQLRPAGGPRIEPDTVQEGQDLTYTAVFEVFPEIELAAVDKLKLTRPTVTVGDADVDEMVQNLRRQRVTWQPVERAAKKDDQVRIDFAGEHKGEPLEGGKGEDVAVVIGEGRMLPDFEKNLTGLKSGEEKSFNLKFPKDYHEASLAGEKVVFTVKALEVAESVLPELDEEFVKSFGVESGAVEDLKADVRRNMDREADARVRAETKREVMEALLAANKIDVPKVMVEQEAASLQADTMRQMGIQDPAQAPELATFMETAERRARLGLLVGAVINDFKIEADRELVKAKVDEVCAPYDDPEQIAGMYYQNPNLLRSVESVVLEDQVVDCILEQAKVSERKVSFNDLVNG